jgi:hypothetical protein
LSGRCSGFLIPDLKLNIYSGMFKRKKTMEQDFDGESNFDEKAEEIPINDKRRFNERGERIDASDAKPAEQAKSAR